MIVLTGCDNVPAGLGGYTYRAEVGYYENDRETWFVGTDKSVSECQSEAVARFNTINRESPKRDFSWACRCGRSAVLSER